MDINKVLRLLRNEGAFTTRQEALEHIETVATERQDGEMWIVSYNDNDVIKTLIAVKRDGENGVTVFDNDGNAEKTETLITEKIEELDVPYYAPQDNTQYIFDVKQTDGKIEKLKGFLKTKSGSPLTIENEQDNRFFDINIDDATIQKESFGGDPIQYRLKVGTVPAAQVSVSDEDFEAENVQTALKELKEEIAEVGSEAKSYKVVEVSSPTSTSQAEYKIQQKVGASGEWGDVTDSATIVVPKDNAFVTAQLGHTGATVDQETGAITDGPDTGKEVLLIEYKNGEGTYILVEIPVDDFLRQSEFKEGLQVNSNGEVSVKIDTTSTGAESFITVGEDGVKISGVQDAIDSTITDLNATVGSTTVATDKHVAVQVVETDGKLTGLTVTEDDIASASRLEEIERVTAEALNDLEMRKATHEDLSEYLIQVFGGSGIEVTNKGAGQTQHISVKLKSDETNSLSIINGELYSSNSVNCGTY